MLSTFLPCMTIFFSFYQLKKYVFAIVTICFTRKYVFTEKDQTKPLQWHLHSDLHGKEMNCIFLIHTFAVKNTLVYIQKERNRNCLQIIFHEWQIDFGGHRKYKKKIL